LPGYRYRLRRRETRDERRRRPLNALWLFFWLILIIILLGLIFGGYRKGSKVPDSWIPVGHSAASVGGRR
jgi:hypothetical protein